ncbi:PriCT-2 domain-containing protein, partial [Chitinilyticum litopenaei]|uniref:PriCT-2 domain-containing protein n=1 Tax=Chitinilyticum litopenaei TaxID=1121276 RepID=UPI00048F141F
MTDPANDIRAALAHIPAHDRALWVCMGMAVKSELGDGGFTLWDDWSQSADNYQPKAARVVWKGLPAAGKVTIASLFHEAIQHGWRPSKPYTPPTPEQRQQIEAARLAAQQQAEQEAERLHAEAKAKAAKLWAAAGAVRADHPYLIAKGIKPVGAKQLRGMLVLPLRAGGELVSLQLIGEDGGKRFLTGGQVKGTALTLGSLKDATEVLLCEGWATGCTLHEATGLPV